MKLKLAGIACVLVLAGWMAAPASADLITGVTATATDTFDYDWAPWSYYATDAVNGTGLSTVDGKLVHTSNDASTPAVVVASGQEIYTWGQWDAAGNPTFANITRGVAADWQTSNGAGAGAAITIDLGATYDVGSFHVWNFNIAGCTVRGMKDVSIFTSANGTDWTSQGGWTFAQASGTDSYEGEEFALAGAWEGVRYVKIENVMSWSSNGDKIGLAEVQFFTGVPEPATLALLAVGGLVGLRRRNRR